MCGQQEILDLFRPLKEIPNRWLSSQCNQIKCINDQYLYIVLKTDNLYDNPCHLYNIGITSYIKEFYSDDFPWMKKGSSLCAIPTTNKQEALIKILNVYIR